MITTLPVRTPTVPPATHTNCYRLGATVVDPASPWPDEQERLGAWAGEIERIVVTHHHADHVGGVADLARRTGAKVYAHRDAQLPFPVDVRLDEGDVIDTGAGRLRCLHTPGHADGHLCFFHEESGEIVAGDMVAGEGTIVLIEPEGDLEAYLASLERLVPIAGRLLPAHGPALEDGPAVLRYYIAHRHMRSAQVEAAVEAGARDAAEVAARVYAGLPGVDLRLAAAQVRTHLAWLARHGRVKARDDGRYTRG